MIILLRHTSLTLALARLSNGFMTSCDVTTCVREVDPKHKPELELIDRNHVDVIAGNGGQKGYQKRQDSCDDIMYFCYRAVDAYYEDSFIDLGAFYHER